MKMGQEWPQLGISPDFLFWAIFVLLTFRNLFRDLFVFQFWAEGPKPMF